MARSTTTWPRTIGTGLGLSVAVLCVLAAPGFSAAAVLAPILGAVSALAAWTSGLRRVACLTGLMALAAPVELVLLDRLSLTGEGLLLFWALLFGVGCALLGSYVRERRRDPRGAGEPGGARVGPTD